jgi:hypothetical protein
MSSALKTILKAGANVATKEKSQIVPRETLKTNSGFLHGEGFVKFYYVMIGGASL